jgi:trimeric autotransporter adhesin
LHQNTSGQDNTAAGYFALYNCSGSSNIAIGSNAGFNLTNGDGNIDIGNGGVAGEITTIRTGVGQTKTFLAGIRGVTTGVSIALPVLIDSNGQLGTASSSSRFKTGIHSMDQKSESILSPRPVTFQYKNDPNATPQFGLIAEEVARENPDLVVRDEKGAIYTVRYDVVNAMLLNEFLKEHRKVEQLQTVITQLSERLDAREAKIEKMDSAAKLVKIR